MEHITNTDSPAFTESLIEPALAAGEDARPGWCLRHDGWGPERIRTFLVTLAECGVVSDAARAAGMSVQGAYALRASAKGRAFHLAWRAALHVAHHRLSDELLSRALNGSIERIYRRGELYEERFRPDNRLLLAVLARLDNKAASRGSDRAAAAVASQFETFVDKVCNEHGDVGAFIRSTKAAFWEEEEVALIERDVDGLPEEVDDEEDDEAAECEAGDEDFGPTCP